MIIFFKSFFIFSIRANFEITRDIINLNIKVFYFISITFILKNMGSKYQLSNKILSVTAEYLISRNVCRVTFKFFNSISLAFIIPYVSGLTFGNVSNNITIKKLFCFQNQNNIRTDLAKIEKPIDIIIPVYNGFKYLEALFSSIFENTDILYRLIIIDDKSPDETIIPYLRNIAQTKNPLCKDIILLENKENLGFTKSVNKSMNYVENHFVLLNTDTEVPKKWLSRLIKPFYTSDRKIASITPFSNSAVYFNYPRVIIDNDILENFNLHDIDEAFSKINDFINYESTFPTGVGFCMAMNYNCFKDIGNFNDEIFQRGYGEENDWCYRAINAGYENIACPNLFVYHKHGGSFSTEEKKQLSDSHAKILGQMYPKQIDCVGLRDSENVFKVYRLLASLFFSESKKGALLFICADVVGGTKVYRENKVKELTEEGYNVLLLIHSPEHIRLYFPFVENSEYISLDNISDISFILDLIKVKRVFVNHLFNISYENLYFFFSMIKEYKLKYNFLLEFLFHEYLSICPSINLLNDKNVYCHIPEYKTCDQCIVYNTNYFNFNCKDIRLWRNLWAFFFDTIDKLTCFSNSSYDIITKAYKNTVSKLEVKPHSINVAYKTKYNPSLWKDSKEFNIALFGHTELNKGHHLLPEIEKILNQNIKNVKIYIFGGVFTAIASNKNIKCIGEYDNNKIPDLLNEYHIDAVIITSICPETFSYVASECILADVPLISFDIGAPPERILNYNKGYLVKEISASSMANKLIEFYKKYIEKGI